MLNMEILMPHIDPDRWNSDSEQRKRDKNRKKRKQNKENKKRKRKDKW